MPTGPAAAAPEQAGGIIKLSRTNGTLAAAAAIFIAFRMWGAIIEISFEHTRDTYQHSETSTEPVVSKAVIEQLTGLALWRRENPGAPQESIVLGSSTGECAIDPGLFARSLGEPEGAWINLHGSSCNGLDLENIWKLIVRLESVPNRLVLVLNPGMLADPRTDPLKEGPGAFGDLRLDLENRTFGRLEPDFCRLTVRRFSLGLENRARIHHICSYFLMDARFALWIDLAADPFAGFPPRTDWRWSGAAWTSMHPQPPRLIAEQMEGFAGRAWFDQELRLEAGANPAAVARLLESAALRCGGGVWLVLLPESTTIRKRVDLDRDSKFVHQLLRNAGLEGAVRVIDARAWISDADFYDAAHLNPRGRPSFTIALAAALKQSPQTERPAPLPPN